MKRTKIIIAAALCVIAAALLLNTAMLAFRVFGQEKRQESVYTTEEKLTEAVQILRDYYVGELDEEVLADAAIAAMVDSLNDQWSYYLSSEDLLSYLNSQNNQYGGLGIVVAADGSGEAVVQKVYEHSPAGKTGVLIGSHFLTAGGTDLRGLGVEDVTACLRGLIAEGLVELTLKTPEGTEQSFRLIPGEVLTDPVSWSVLDSGLGYIRIENFEARSGDLAIKAMEDLLARQVPGVIFDVRENPGGQLTELLKILDYLLPEGTLFRSRSADGTESSEVSDAACVPLPMAVLVNEDSYSAAEFFAAALNDYDWALVVGAQTSGKGAAQVTITLQDASAIHVSNIYYFTPEGKSLIDVGLTPDLSVELSDEARAYLFYGLLTYADDLQLQAAEAALRQEVPD